MNNNIVDRAIENSQIREKLHGAGIFPTLIVGPATLQLQTSIENLGSSNIKFTYMNIILKSYKA